MKLKIPPAIVFLICTILIVAIKKSMPAYQLTIPFNNLIGYGLFLSGVFIGLAGIIEFRKYETTVDPANPEKASLVVTTGIYQITRNPMYLGMAVGLFGEVTYYSNLISLVSIPLFTWYLTQFQIKPEEEILKEKFGQSYTDYSNKVRRWL